MEFRKWQWDITCDPGKEFWYRKKKFRSNVTSLIARVISTKEIDPFKFRSSEMNGPYIEAVSWLDAIVPGFMIVYSCTKSFLYFHRCYIRCYKKLESIRYWRNLTKRIECLTPDITIRVRLEHYISLVAFTVQETTRSTDRSSLWSLTQ